jgi:Mg2+ and Co2+ transporter CorA
MLRSELPFASEGWLRRLLAVLLGEAFLGFLAIVALGLTLFPMLFSLPAAVETGIDAAQWGIIGWFAVEFVCAFAFASDKSRFFTNPWRWLDLLIIVIALASLLPSGSATLRSAPILRLARIGRLVSLGVRASGLSARGRTRHEAEVRAHGPAQVAVVARDPDIAPEPAALAQALSWLRAPDEQWFHVANPGADELQQIESAAGLPAGYLETHLHGMSYPHWATAGPRTGLFLRVPEVDSDGLTDRYALLLLPFGAGLLSLSRRKLRAVERVVGHSDASGGKLPFAAQMIVSVFERVLRNNERLAGSCAERLRELEEVPVNESRPAFFERTFQLKKELSAAQTDLWRLKGIAADLASGHVNWAGLQEAVALYPRFPSRVDYLYETMVNIREGVLSVIELHLNVVSFEMNRVMRVLAVVSVLGLIPAVIGGLLGMNLIDNPWAVTLPQVSFVVLFGMVLGLYFFVVKGWLR